MNKFIKNNIKVFMAVIITAIVVGSTTGVIAYNYNASNISYKPKDSTWNVDNVNDAIDSLKTNYSVGETYSNIVSYATRPATSVVSLDLKKGLYICNVAVSIAHGGTQAANQAANHNTTISDCDNYKEGVKNGWMRQSTNTSYNGTGWITVLWNLSFSCRVNNDKSIKASTVNYTGTYQYADGQSTISEISCTRISE